VYTYSLAACLLEEGDASREEADALLKKVPDLRQRIAGKSIPLEARHRLRAAPVFGLTPRAEVRRTPGSAIHDKSEACAGSACA
jgi:hypothetical protein